MLHRSIPPILIPASGASHFSLALNVRADAHDHCPIDSPIDQLKFSIGQWRHHDNQCNHEACHRSFAVNREFGAASIAFPNCVKHKTFHDPPHLHVSYFITFSFFNHITLLQHFCFDTCSAFKLSRGVL